jgi:hypothetical protein
MRKKQYFKKRQWKPPIKKEKGWENPHKPKPEEQEGMLQHQHCPPGKRPKERTPKYHEEQQKDVA